MKGCARLESGIVELYFYDELGAGERAEMTRHVASCLDCRNGLEELETIRAALATRPMVSAPPGGDWSGFMARLDRAVSAAPRAAATAPAVDAVGSAPRDRQPASFRTAPSLAIAATLVLAATSLVFVARGGWGRGATGSRAPGIAAVVPASPQAANTAENEDAGEAAFAMLSEQHFERSKLVVLGIASKDARRVTREDWEFERQLASSLLTDTRLYRLAAEERGMKRIAGVMGDLELVLLQTSFGAQSGPEDLEQIQRLIDKRDLVTKMDLGAGI